MRAIQMIHTVDPKKEIFDAIKNYIDGWTVLGADVLVAIYIRPKKTAGGIFLTDDSQDEDKHQGKVGLVLQMGPLAFEDDDNHRFGKTRPKVGDWVLYRVGDTFPLIIGRRDCRFVQDVNIHAIVPAPDLTF